MPKENFKEGKKGKLKVFEVLVLIAQLYQVIIIFFCKIKWGFKQKYKTENFSN